ncbi:MAG: hypothetical protein EKK62_01630 [Acidimicrobiia bacterium]|nr:MAG: hypothetical protein EKK62_01630 [Acidimicrobiia bacterium]
MTTYDEPITTDDDVPDHVLEQQAAEHAGHAPTAHRSGAPIHDTDAEEAALGIMLVSAKATETAIDSGLEPEHFYVPAHREIYTAVCHVVAAGHKPDATLVGMELGWPRERLGRLLDLMGSAPHTSGIGRYVGRIRQLATARALQARALEVSTAAAHGQLDEALRLVTKLTDAIPADETHGGWHPHDLTEVLAGASTGPVPTVLAVQGAAALFYTGRTNLIFGESGAGKTWVALLAVREALAEGHGVIYIDLEDTPEGLVSRLRLLGCTDDQLARHLVYIQPEVPWGATAQAALARLIDDRDVALVVLDSTGEAMATDGVKGNDDDDVARWFSACPKYLARRGPAVVIIDHIPKNDQDAPLSPIGSQRKKAAIDGAAYRIDAPKPPSKDREGLLVATTSKDRHGTRSKGQKAAEVALVPSPHGGMAAGVTAPQTAPLVAGEKFRPTVLMERVSETVQAHPGMSQERIVSMTTGKAKHLREALGCLIAEGYVEMDPTPGKFAYRSVKPFRADAEPVDNLPAEVHEVSEGEPEGWSE